ncbi:filamentous hemagglutinin N-terminal domain-containing protein, partial [Leptolyngbya cf. ectocarpi LEGE 11479]
MRLRALIYSAVLSVSGVLAAGEIPVAAQSHLITPDGTLGSEGSTVTTVAPQVDLLGGGALRDEYLFHSFEEFNIGEGWTANFANPDGVFNILSRVTGQNPSHLFGTLGVLGNADLFFINPNGVLFGPDASLDIPGSLTVSTADELVLPDGSVFSATSPGVPQLLDIDVDVPIGVRFDRELAAALGNEALLEVGENLTLSAGDIDSTGGLFAPNGDVLVEGVSGDVRVQELAAQSAVLSARENLILEESQLQTAGNLSLLAGDTVRVR